MATVSDHIVLANRNHLALAYLLQRHEDFPEWVVCVGFYKALHVVDAMFIALGEDPPSNHGEREDMLKEGEQFKFLYRHYRPLWNASSIARYLCDRSGNGYKSFASYLSADDARDFVKSKLREIEDAALMELSDKTLFKDLTRTA